MANSQVNELEIKVYKRRWFVLALLVWLMFLSMFSYTNFAFVNNILVVYFQTSYAAVDWMILGNIVGSVVASPIVAWLALKNVISFRKAMISAALLQAANLILIIVGFFRPTLFGLVVFGQTLGGIAMAIIWSVPSALAQLWFPESQIGLATGISMFGASAGAITACMLPSHTLLSPQMKNSSIAVLEKIKNVTRPHWFQYDKFVYEIMFSALLISALCVLLALLTLVPEMPDKPPTQAQRLKRNQQQIENHPSAHYFSEIKQLMTDSTFVGCTVGSSLIFHSWILFDISIEQIIERLSLNNSFLSQSPEMFSAYAVCIYSVGCWIGNLAAGLLLDGFKKYHLQSSLGALSTFLVSIAFFLSIYYRNVITFFIFCLVIGMCMKVGYISLIDSLMQHTYPTEPVFVMSILTFIQNVTAIIITEGGRQIDYSAGLLAELCFMSIMLLFSFILSLIFKPTTKRLSVENSEIEGNATLLPPHYVGAVSGENCSPPTIKK